MVPSVDPGLVRCSSPPMTVEPSGSTAGAGFDNRVRLAPGTQKTRVSTGAELQVRIPGLNVPLRFYAGYNPRAFRGVLNTPVVADASYFPNSVTYENALNLVGPRPLSERSYFARFAIGHTF